MENPEFEWDDEKAVTNLKKHNVSFEEGATILMTRWLLRSSTLNILNMKRDAFQLELLYKGDCWLSYTPNEKSETV